MSEKDMLKRIKAREELKRMGYRWEHCEHCRGLGTLPGRNSMEKTVCTCWHCDGRGGHWKGPVTK